MFVSENSRGWEYNSYYCNESVNDFIKNSYEPEQYDNINLLPPADVLLETTENNYIDIILDKGIYYITIMPYDQHGLDIGKEWYLPSNELTIMIE